MKQKYDIRKQSDANLDKIKKQIMQTLSSLEQQEEQQEEQQAEVCLKTSENLDDVERIARHLGMDIILKSDSMEFELSDLSIEDKMAYVDTIEKEVKDALKLFERYRKNLRDLHIESRKYGNELLQIMKSHRASPTTDIGRAITTLSNKRERSDWYRKYCDVYNRHLTLPTGYDLDRVAGSCLIAKKGENILRYTSIGRSFSVYRTSMIRITGPDAYSLRRELKRSKGEK